MKTHYIGLMSAALFATTLQTQADTKIHPSLGEIAKKIDTDGEYLQLNYLKNDIKKLVDYGELFIKVLKENEEDVPKDINIAKLLDMSGINDLVAMGVSNKKVEGSWNTTQYIFNGGSTKGFNTIYGGKAEKFEVAEFAPETSDYVMQMRLDLRQVKPIVEEFATQIGQMDEVNREMNKALPELGGMTPFEIIEKMNIRANIVIDVDREKRLAMPGVDLPTTDVIVRLDDVSWLWKFIEPQLLEGPGAPPIQKKVEGDVTTYTFPEEMEPQMMGYSPIIRVDKNHIWLASKKSVLSAALADGPKLKDGAAFQKTMSSLSKEGNWLIYLSDDMQDEFVALYRQFAVMSLAQTPEYKEYSPLIDKIIADFTATESGIAMVLDVDDQGVSAVVRMPFAFKNYLEQLFPMFSQLALIGGLEDELNTLKPRKGR